MISSLKVWLFQLQCSIDKLQAYLVLFYHWKKWAETLSFMHPFLLYVGFSLFFQYLYLFWIDNTALKGDSSTLNMSLIPSPSLHHCYWYLSRKYPSFHLMWGNQYATLLSDLFDSCCLVLFFILNLPALFKPLLSILYCWYPFGES